MPKSIVSFGEILWDILPSGAKLGGAPFNFAYRMHSLGDVGWIVSRLGRDDRGRKALKRIRALGMDATHIQIENEHPTGIVHVHLDEKKIPTCQIVRDVAYDHIEITPDLLTVAAQSDCICFGTLSQRCPTTRKTLYQLLDASATPLKFLDINFRRDCYSRETVQESLERADILKLNDDEVKQLADMIGLTGKTFAQVIHHLRSQFSLNCCVVTLGSAGALACAVDETIVYVPGYQIDPVDTLGAGDAFAAGFLHKRLRHAPLSDCCDFGNVLGAIVASQNGATTPVTWNDVNQFIHTARGRVSQKEWEPYLEN